MDSKQSSEREAILRLNAVIETAIDGILTIDRLGTIESINPAGAKLFDYAPEDVIGENVKILMPSPYHDEHDGYLSNYATTGKRKIIGIGREVQGRKKNGDTFPLRLAVSELNINGKVIYTGIIHDLTDVKNAEQGLIELNHELEAKVLDRTEALKNSLRDLEKTNQLLQLSFEKEQELNALKSRFMSMASHEFRTPLATILSSTELIDMSVKRNKPEQLEKYISRIINGVNYLEGVLTDFMSLNKMDQGLVDSTFSSFSLLTFCEEMVEEFVDQSKDLRKINFKSNLNREMIIQDKNFLRHIFYNLFSNATKYSAVEKPIDFEVKEVEQTYVFAISDQGIGIPEGEQKYLFNRFFRAENVENIKGTGLGLVIVKKYVDLLGGSINFSSLPNPITTFTVTLPKQKT